MRLELKKRSDSRCDRGLPRQSAQPAALARRPDRSAVLGIDPGLRTGCKIAVVDETGKFLAHDVIYPFTSKSGAGASGQGLGEA